MKKTILLIVTIVVLCLISLFLLFFNKERKNSEDGIKTIPDPAYYMNDGETQNSAEGTQDNDTLKVNWIEVRDLSNVFLYSNLEDRLQAKELKNKYGCSSLVNATFYTKENSHVGLFVTEGNTLESWKSSNLFNGVFSITKNQIGKITGEPIENARIAVQSGPILMRNGFEAGLKIQNDKPARRMVAALKKNNNLVFIAFYNQNLKTSGPTLAELPSLLSKLNKDKKMGISDAINLDGGSASSFISEDVNLQEISRSGSFFCVQSSLIIY